MQPEYKIGQKVWFIHKIADKWVPKKCETCEGFGVLVTKGTGEEVECYSCRGNGTVMKEEKVKWSVYQNYSKITSITITKDEISYVAEGISIPVDMIGRTIFFTKGEAELMCDKINKEDK